MITSNLQGFYTLVSGSEWTRSKCFALDPFTLLTNYFCPSL
jgi:hypothetical protein